MPNDCTNWRKSSANDAAGSARKVTELIEVPSIDSPTAHPGKERLPRKYSSVLLFFLAK